MSDLFETAFLYMIEGTVAAFLLIPLFFFPYHHNTQEMCNEVMCINPLSLLYVPDHLQTKKMCERKFDVFKKSHAP